VRRTLKPSGRFSRAAKRFLKLHPSSAGALEAVLEKLAEDAFQPSLRTHKLKGALSGRWACSGGFDLRVMFEVIVDPAGHEVVLLESVGTHEDVY
jgi:mRNA-degrading endonuclease YafQ of YafQ-DinJ toxin-antitoxin module